MLRRSHFSLPPPGLLQAHAALTTAEAAQGAPFDAEGRAGYMRASLLSPAQRAAIEALAAEFPSYAKAIAYAPVGQWKYVIDAARGIIEHLDPKVHDLAPDAANAMRRRGLELLDQVAHELGVNE
jgi:hypothetical protein